MASDSTRQWVKVMEGLEEPGEKPLDLWLAAVGDTLRHALPEASYLRTELDALIDEVKRTPDGASDDFNREIIQKCQSIISVSRNLLDGASKAEKSQHLDGDIESLVRRTFFKSWPFLATLILLITATVFSGIGAYQNFWRFGGFGEMTDEERQEFRREAIERFVGSIEEDMGAERPRIRERIDEILQAHRDSVARQMKSLISELTAELEASAAKLGEDLVAKTASLSEDINAQAKRFQADTDAEVKRVEGRAEGAVATVDTLSKETQARVAQLEDLTTEMEAKQLALSGKLEQLGAEYTSELTEIFETARDTHLEKLASVRSRGIDDIQSAALDLRRQLEGDLADIEQKKRDAGARIDSIVEAFPERVNDLEKSIRSLESRIAEIQKDAEELNATLEKKSSVIKRLERMFKTLEK